MIRDQRQSPPLSRSNVGHVPLISLEAAERIIKATDLTPVAGVKFKNVASALNHIVDLVLSQQLTARFGKADKQKIEEMFQALTLYQRHATSLSRVNSLPPYFAPPIPAPHDWYGEALLRLVTARNIIVDQKGGGRPGKDETRHLYPATLGLFLAVFGVRPTSTTDRGASHAGPAARFVIRLTDEARDAISSRSLEENVSSDAVDRARWITPEPAALERQIRNALQLESDLTNEEMQLGTEVLRKQVKRYRSLYLKPPEAPEVDLRKTWSWYANFFASTYLSVGLFRRNNRDGNL